MLFWELDYLCLVLSVAMVLDIVIGDPDWLYKRLPHPVVLFGRLLSFVELRLNHASSRFYSIAYGGLALFSVLLVCVSMAWLLAWLGGVIVEILVVAILLAQNSLYKHVKAVGDELGEGNLQGAKVALQKLVSRDADKLDEYGVGRSAIESLSENYSDAVIAPIFWFLVGGLPFLVFYKVVNTADSMWGYRNDRYETFGKITARLDDVLNYVPSRLSVLPVVLVAFVLPKSNMKRLFAWLRSEPRKHSSPNAGYPETAFAGALNLSLGGSRYYTGEGEKSTWIGRGNANIGSIEIASALGLYKYAIFVLLLCFFGIALW